MPKIISKRGREDVYRQPKDEAEQIEKANAECDQLKSDDEWMEHILDQTTRDIGIFDVNFKRTLI